MYQNEYPSHTGAGMFQVITITGRLAERLPSGYAILEVMSSYVPRNGSEVEVSLAYVYLKQIFVQDFPIGAAVFTEGRFLGNEKGNPLTNSDGEPFFMFEPYSINNLGTASLDRQDTFQARVIGNLGRPPGERFSRKGKSYISASLATNLVDKDNQKITVWFGLIQSRGETLLSTKRRGVEIPHVKGDMLYVEGRIDVDPFTGGPKTWQSQDGRMLAEYKIFTNWVTLISKYESGPEPPPMWQEGEMDY
jgi:hypothetical protein